MTDRKTKFSSYVKLIDSTLTLASKESHAFYVESYGKIFRTYKFKRHKILKSKPTTRRLSKKERQRIENERKEKEYQKGTFKKNMRALAILLVLGVFTGSGLGVWYFNSVLKSNVDYSAYNVGDYLPDYDAPFEKLGITSEEDKEDFVNIANENQITPLSLSALDNFLLALYNAERATSYSAIGIGNVSTISPQSIYSAKYFDGETYTFESISVGLLQVATKDELKKGENIVTINSGSSITQNDDGSMTAQWSPDQTISLKEYKDLTGNYLYTLNPYIISEKTILNYDQVTVSANEDGSYSFTFELHPIYGVLNYYKQVKRSGSLEADPVFTSISQVITIDDEWNFVSFDTTESYTAVKFSMGAKCTGSLHTEFQFNF